MKEFKCRASAMGVLMMGYKSIDKKGLDRIQALDYEHQHGKNLNGNKVKWTDAKEKELTNLIHLLENPELGETAKSYLKEWFISQITGKSKDIESKYFDHGNFAEQAVLDRASKHYGVKFEKNEEHLTNDFFTGTFDSKDKDIVIDAKAPYDVFTFPYFDEQPPKGYYEQLQVYMALTGLKKAALVYGLENHSEDEIERLSWKLAKKEAKELNLDEFEPEMKHWDEAKKLLTFDHLPDNLRIRTFEFERNDELIEKMQQRVIEAREYIKEVLTPQFETNFKL